MRLRDDQSVAQNQPSALEALVAEPTAEIVTFLIADIRGYTSFTQSHGDEAAARLAMTFAEIATEGIEARGGRLVSLRGDEALGVFGSARQALRAAVDLQLTFLDEIDLDPSMPLRVGIGIDAGEAVQVEDGYRGGALNLAARLCSHAGPVEILTTESLVHLARATDGLWFLPRGAVEFKGLAEPVQVLQVLAAGLDAVEVTERVETAAARVAGRVEPSVRRELLAALDPSTPLFGRDVEARWIRWSWRRSRSGPGRAIAITAPEGGGKTRLAAEVATLVASTGAPVGYASCAAANSGIGAAVESFLTDGGPSLLIVDDVDAGSDDDLAALASLKGKLTSHRGLVVVASREGAPDGVISLLRQLVGQDGVRRLGPLDTDGIRAIASLYQPDPTTAIPVEAIMEMSGGLAASVHDVAARWAQDEASRRLGESTSQAATSRGDLRAMEAQVATNVVDLQRARERTRLLGGNRGVFSEECPFKGLATFEVADVDLFFGRERLIAEMVARIVGSSFLGVVGPSGSGKSSTVRAGLAPAVAAGVLPGSEAWIRVVARPGEHPMRSLDRSLYAALPEGMRASLAGAGDSLQAAIDLLPEQTRLFIVIDQFEEVFTTCRDESEREMFISELAGAVRDVSDRIVIVIAVRADFYGRCAAYPELAELLGTNHVLVGPMTAEEYRRAIEGPIRRAGLRIDPVLVDALVAEVVDEPGGLPLLSTALFELWGHRERRRIEMEAYVKTGGVKGAVARLAERAFNDLNETQQVVVRSVMLRLADVDGSGSAVRRRVPLAEFEAEENPDIARVLDVLTGQRLITVSEGTVEVAHEALLREWPRLEEWLEEDRASRRHRRHLTTAAKEWQVGGLDTAELYRGARLASALDWTTEHNLELNELERRFLAESRSVAERESERQRRTNRRLRGLVTGIALVLVVALVAGGVALEQRGRAREAALGALSQSLGSQGVNEPRLDRALLLAREAVNLDVSERTRSTLLATVLRAPAAVGVLYGGDTGRRPVGIALSPDGKTLAVQYNVTDLELFDTSTFQSRVTVPNGAAGSPIFSPDGSLIAVPSAGKDLTRVTDGGAVDLRDPSTGRLLRTLQAAPVSGNRVAALNQITFSSDGRSLYGLLVVARYGQPAEADYVVHWEVANGKLIGSAKKVSDGDAVGFGLTTSGKLILSGRRTTIWEARTMKLVGRLQVGGAVTVGATPDGTTMAFGEADGSVRFVDLGTGRERTGAGRHTAAVQSIGFTADSKTAISTGDDGRVLIWDVATATVTQDLAGHGGSVKAQANDGRTLYTASSDGTVFAWDLSGTRRFGREFTAGSGDETLLYGSIPWFAISPDGQTLAVTQADGYVNLWSLTTVRQIETFRAVPHGPLISANFSPDGKTLAATGINGQLLLWDLTASPPTSRPLTGLPHTTGYELVAWAAFSPDGSTLAAGDWQQLSYSTGEGEVGSATSGDLAVWDAQSGDIIQGPSHLGGAMSQVIFNPDGTMMAVTLGDGNVRLIDAHSLQVIRTLAADTLVPPTYFEAFSPDGRTLATGGTSGVVRLWDVASGRQIAHFLAAAGGVLSVVFDPTGQLIATGGTDGSTRLWDAATGNQFGATFPGLDNVWDAASFTPDGSRLVVVYSNGQAFLWPARWQAWAAQACAVAGRDLTTAEWKAFIPDRPYEHVCPGAVP
ncbi:MAG: adenylate/guanylate cyclase domain-containing protein [Actinomycetota bacterium]